jgi:hypothetical protein
MILDQLNNGELFEEGFKNMALHMLGSDPAKMKTAMEIFATCGKITDSDPCDKAAKIGDCLKVEGEKSGIKLTL